MDEERPLFILAGNGPYENRGCEAIIRGTTQILRDSFCDPRFVCLSHYLSDRQYRRQCMQETDDSIVHLHSYRLNRKAIARHFWRPFYLGYAYDHFRRPWALKYRIYAQMLPYLDDAAAVLSVGGDNYSLDYGVTTLYTDLDDIAIEKRKPIVLWGASVGPFSALPDYERHMIGHLRKVTGILARESSTVEYLESIGVARNVHQIADPAFLMDAVRPEGIEDVLPIQEGAIGLNLSPLMALYVTGGDLDAWVRMAARIISQIAAATEMPVYLIPHVTTPSANDHAFMQQALSLAGERNDGIIPVPPVYNAAETKWIIGRMALFAGARTHSTIAALSSGVPTLSFAYSIKARGINRDLFGHTDYCVDTADLDAGAVAGRIVSMLDESAAIRNELAAGIPDVRRAAKDAGTILKHLAGEDR
ncbi:MAG: polysaccharide pyruvyl transferase family protein [Methanomicrobiaceae archaeon]|nr:polysaccharide pyruvyl transferase family protein [Methanomicrobiaceae archaeon]MDD5419033.1 polysaccharide pyruvyl transferase family protein [Methanomicrobiaceae archaeon]